MKFNLFGRTFSFLADSLQREKAFYMIKEYILRTEVLILAALVVLYFILKVYAKLSEKQKLSDMLKKLSPWIYFLIILGITFLNRDLGIREIRLCPDPWLASNGRVHESAILGFAFNTCLYIPLGYLLYKFLNFPKKWLVTIGIVFFSSILIESMQYIFARGVTAIDDLVANTMGGLLGLIFAITFSKIKEKKHILE